VGRPEPAASSRPATRRNVTIAARRGRGRASIYQITDKTRFVNGGTLRAWSDVMVGTHVQVRRHRAGNQRMADVVDVVTRPRH